MRSSTRNSQGRLSNVSKRIGLPVTLKMRHDAHYVESLTSYSGAAVGRMIRVDQIRPNPDQPRKTLGDLRELTESIREKGVLEPLLVRYVPREDCFHIISGERRYHASRAAGDRKSTRLNSSHGYISYAVFCLKQKRRIGTSGTTA